MGVSRRFLNLVVDNRIQGARSLNCIDLRRRKLFNTRTPVLPPPKGNSSESERPPQDDRKNYRQAAASSITRKIRDIQLPQPTMNFRCSIVDSYWYMKCFPLAGRKLLCVDPSYRTVLFDVNTRQVEIIPYLHVAKHKPLPCFVPLPSSADAADDGNGSFYILEGSPYQIRRSCRETTTPDSS
ncbi:hypothetical protein BDA96_09G260100 [Sorghum bicolor]|uniref:Uncharacterized protein n=1 Tax=Sorghum bicolor TaxID=4558 RepID=A0A921QCU8_SORBI|nr:hypothetical protein BDA96_09G260100 [Sorghum bicolor]